MRFRGVVTFEFLVVDELNLFKFANALVNLFNINFTGVFLVEDLEDGLVLQLVNREFVSVGFHHFSPRGFLFVDLSYFSQFTFWVSFGRGFSRFSDFGPFFFLLIFLNSRCFERVYLVYIRIFMARLVQEGAL